MATEADRRAQAQRAMQEYNARNSPETMARRQAEALERIATALERLAEQHGSAA